MHIHAQTQVELDRTEALVLSGSDQHAAIATSITNFNHNFYHNFDHSVDRNGNPSLEHVGSYRDVDREKACHCGPVRTLERENICLCGPGRQTQVELDRTEAFALSGSDEHAAIATSITNFYRNFYHNFDHNVDHTPTSSMFGAIGMWIEKRRAIVGANGSWSGNIRGFVGPDVRWSVKT